MGKIRITQVRNPGSPEKHRKTLQALGLKHQRSVVQEDNDAVRGMVFSVRHLLKVEKVSDAAADVPANSIDPVGDGAPRALLRNAAVGPGHLAAMADYDRARRGFATDAELADVLGVHRSRLAGWKQGLAAPTTENARLLSHLAVTVTELEEFLDPDVIPDWLLSEQETLGGQSPAQALREGRLAEVLFAANATEHGAYV